VTPLQCLVLPIYACTLSWEMPSFGSSCSANETIGRGSGGRRLSGGDGGAHIWNKRRSMCERINEEKEDIIEISGQPDRLSPTTRLADFDHLSIYKRHHQPRQALPRSSSSPNLINILLSDHPISLDQLQNHPPPPLSPLQPPKATQRTKTAPPTKQMATLLPRADSFNARTRGASQFDFRTATTGVQGKAMRNELSQLVNTVQNSQQRKASSLSTIYAAQLLIFISQIQTFDTEMQSFFYLFTRYLAERAQAQGLSVVPPLILS
jgi:UTP--glucose-1-phosphate uridylyltransferase